MMSEIEMHIDRTIVRLKNFQSKDPDTFDDARKKVRTFNKQMQ